MHPTDPAPARRLVQCDLRAAAPVFIDLAWAREPAATAAAETNGGGDIDDDTDSDIVVVEPAKEPAVDPVRLNVRVLVDGRSWFAASADTDMLLAMRPPGMEAAEFLDYLRDQLGLAAPQGETATVSAVPDADCTWRVTARTTRAPRLDILNLHLAPVADAEEAAEHLVSLLAFCAARAPAAEPSGAPATASTRRTSASTAAAAAKSTSAKAPAKKSSSSSTEKERERLAKEAEKEAREAERLAKQRERDEAKAEKEAREAERLAKQRERDEAKAEKLREKQARDAEKERARLERERAKAEKEREKKKPLGSTSIMGMFVKRTAKPAPAPAAAGGVAEKRYFDAVFTDFMVRKDVYMCPPVAHAVAVDAEPKDPMAWLRWVRAQKPPAVPLDRVIPGFSSSTAATDDDIIEVVLRFKLLQFAGNRRPAYWGTWRKRSPRVHGRRPFGRDPAVFDYDYDSEAEWEEDEEGEEIRSDDDDDDDEDVDAGESEDETGWLVDDDSPATRVAAPAMAVSASAASAAAGPKKRVMRSLAPIVLGPFDVADECPHPALEDYAAVFFGGLTGPVDPRAPAVVHAAESSSATGGSAAASAAHHATATATANHSRRSTAHAFPEEHILKFIRMVHGNPHGVMKIVEELKATPEFANTAKTQLEAKLKLITVKEKRLSSRSCFYVRDAVLKEHKLSPATLTVEDDDDDIDFVGETPAKLPAPAAAGAGATPTSPARGPSIKSLLLNTASVSIPAIPPPANPKKRLDDFAVETDVPSKRQRLNSTGATPTRPPAAVSSSSTTASSLLLPPKLAIVGGSPVRSRTPTPIVITISSEPDEASLPGAAPADGDGDGDAAMAEVYYDFAQLDTLPPTSPADALNIVKQLALGTDALDRRSAALRALGTWQARVSQDPALPAAHWATLVDAPEFWDRAVLYKCLLLPVTWKNTLRLLCEIANAPPSRVPPARREAFLGRVDRELGNQIDSIADHAAQLGHADVLNRASQLLALLAEVVECRAGDADGFWGMVNAAVARAGLPPRPEGSVADTLQATRHFAVTQIRTLVARFPAHLGIASARVPHANRAWLLQKLGEMREDVHLAASADEVETCLVLLQTGSEAGAEAGRAEV
ncbi:hypothetical protein H9P43_007576 [Blastocladiella emersonii ATCC 22665]|nr:hypothetical protein H9P43_007576 [Blastocladiella emersonii ATCC 22665]